MKTHLYGLMAASGFVVLVSAMSLSTPRAVSGQGKGNGPSGPDVRVVNTAAEAVPTKAQGTTLVEGSVTLSSSGNTVRAAQSGDWSVGILGTPTVNLANSAAVKASQNGDWTVGIRGTPTVSLAQGTTVQVAPKATKIFREHLSTYGALLSDVRNTTSDLLVIDLVNGISDGGEGVIFQIDGGADYWFPGTGFGAINAQTKVYVLPGETVKLITPTSRVWVVGHFEPYAP